MTATELRPKQIEETIIKFKRNRDFAVYLCYDANAKVYIVSREIPEAIHQYRAKTVKEAESKYEEYCTSIRAELTKPTYRKFYN